MINLIGTATAIICGAGEVPKTQKPPILVEEEVYCGECHNLHELEKCPDCDAWIYIFYGIIPGGLGLTKICDADEPCGWVFYIPDNDDE